MKGGKTSHSLYLLNTEVIIVNAAYVHNSDFTYLRDHKVTITTTQVVIPQITNHY